MPITYCHREELQHIFIDEEEYLRDHEGNWMELKYVSRDTNKALETAYAGWLNQQ